MKWLFNGVEYGAWDEMKMAELEAKGRENWDVDDWEAYHYIENINAECDCYDEYDCYDDYDD